MHAKLTAMIALIGMAFGQLNYLQQTYSVTISSVELSPSGNELAVANVDGSLRILNPFTGNVELILQSSGEFIADIGWSPDGTELATVTYAGQLDIWEIPSAIKRISVEIESRSGFAPQLTALSWSPESTELAIAGMNLGTAIVSANTGESITILETGETYDLAWGPHENLFIASLIGIMVWDKVELTSLLSAVNTTGIPGIIPFAMAINNDGTRLAIEVDSFSDSNVEDNESIITEVELRIYELPSFVLTSSSQIPQGGVHMVWSSDSRRLALGSFDDTIRVWETTSLNLLSETDVDNYINAFDWSNSNEIIYLNDNDEINTIQIPELDPTMTPSWTYTPTPTATPTSTATSTPLPG